MYLNFEEKWWLIGKSPDASECESGNSLKDPAALKARRVSSDLVTYRAIVWEPIES